MLLRLAAACAEMLLNLKCTERPRHWPAFIPLIKECVGEWTADCQDGDSSDVSGYFLWQTLANEYHTPSPVPELHGALR